MNFWNPSEIPNWIWREGTMQCTIALSDSFMVIVSQTVGTNNSMSIPLVHDPVVAGNLKTKGNRLPIALCVHSLCG